MKVVCVGHSTYDTTLPMDFYPTENLKYRISHHIECGGGPASNGAYLLAKWGMDTSLFSAVGDDYYGHQIIDEFRSVGTNIDGIEVHSDYMTPSSYIIANRSSGSRTVITSKGVPIRKLRHDGRVKADLILVDGEHPETAETVLRANPDAISIIDAGRLTDDTKRLGKLVKYVVCSKDFAENFVGRKIDVNDKDSLIYCYEKLHDYFQNTVVITLEDKGSFTKLNDYEIIPSVKVQAVDSTGAGDIFHGAFTYFIGNGYSLKNAIHYASITSAISVTRVGARISIPELSEVLNYDELI
ncbi:MAG TPA: carbohydrate kinase family protein [Candidatus Faecimonas gallistercoris]|nr:carbohydrate kinase family protein [Candidatus Faecimonas gallistercoris]